MEKLLFVFQLIFECVHSFPYFMWIVKLFVELNVIYDLSSFARIQSKIFYLFSAGKETVGMPFTNNRCYMYRIRWSYIHLRFISNGLYFALKCKCMDDEIRYVAVAVNKQWTLVFYQKHENLQENDWINGGWTRKKYYRTRDKNKKMKGNLW